MLPYRPLLSFHIKVLSSLIIAEIFLFFKSILHGKFSGETAYYKSFKANLIKAKSNK